MKVARAEAEEQTRVALLDAADDAFVSGPWEHASLEAIARAADVTKQTLLRHFGSKDRLLERVLLRSVEEVERQQLSVPTDDVAGAVARFRRVAYRCQPVRAPAASCGVDRGL